MAMMVGGGHHQYGQTCMVVSGCGAAASRVPAGHELWDNGQAGHRISCNAVTTNTSTTATNTTRLVIPPCIPGSGRVSGDITKDTVPGVAFLLVALP